MEELQNENAHAPSQTPNQSTLDAHRLLVMWLFISTITIGVGFLALVLYFDVTGRGGLTIMIAVIVAEEASSAVCDAYTTLKTSSRGANTFNCFES
jgi:hypothetical protein